MHIDRRALARDLPEAVAQGAFSFAWYALPDAVHSRRARAAAKVALAVPIVAMEVAQARRAGTSPEAQEGAAATREALAKLRTPGRAQAVALGAGALLVGAVLAGILAAEGAVYRYGLRLERRGVRLPHTRIGAVAGLATAAVSLATARTVTSEPPDSRPPA